VKKIDTDINKNLFTVYFADSAKIQIDDFRKKVEGAGYSIARLNLYLNMDPVTVKNDAHLMLSDILYHFMNIKEQRLAGIVKMQVLDKGFTSAKEYKKNSQYTRMECFKTGYMEKCCTGMPAVAGNPRIYHVTI
jgi:hypothetical protein